MTYSQGATPIPPPPGGGNRNSQHVVGGKTSNLGYSAGANLQNARSLYQKGRAGSTFRNQSAVRPQFNVANPTNQAQATGNQLRANTVGLIRPANNTPGFSDYYAGNYRAAAEPIRQHIIPTTDGFEYGGTGLAAIRPPEAVAPTVAAPVIAAPPPPITASPLTGTTTNGMFVSDHLKELVKRQQDARTPVQKREDAIKPVATMTLAQAVVAFGNKPRTFKDAAGNVRRTSAWSEYLSSNGIDTAPTSSKPTTSTAVAPRPPAAVAPTAPTPAAPPAPIVNPVTALANARVAWNSGPMGQVKLSNGSFAPIYGVKGASYIHPTWQAWMKAAGVTKV